ncbi:hypothetical protein TIFTF001_034345 [Ficus carica]|uniref:Uncharacterized protein n=1 Tax=Ficus carica TaxID=3494 RepID=A0AA88E2K6_FICCA|nr:hypothetical protein TIFTF001_034345 [Ficus carica]
MVKGAADDMHGRNSPKEKVMRAKRVCLWGQLGPVLWRGVPGLTRGGFWWARGLATRLARMARAC